jgi:hypothetical protein
MASFAAGAFSSPVSRGSLGGGSGGGGGSWGGFGSGGSTAHGSASSRGSSSSAGSLPGQSCSVSHAEWSREERRVRLAQRLADRARSSRSQLLAAHRRDGAVPSESLRYEISQATRTALRSELVDEDLNWFGEDELIAMEVLIMQELLAEEERQLELEAADLRRRDEQELEHYGRSGGSSAFAESGTLRVFLPVLFTHSMALCPASRLTRLTLPFLPRFRKQAFCVLFVRSATSSRRAR